MPLVGMAFLALQGSPAIPKELLLKELIHTQLTLLESTPTEMEGWSFLYDGFWPGPWSCLGAGKLP